jgi:hypothetical protein
LGRLAIEQVDGPKAQPQAPAEVIIHVEVRDRRDGNRGLEILQFSRRVVAVVIFVLG